MARIYTGQHGEFLIWINERALGDTDSIDVSRTTPSIGIEYGIDNIGAVSRAGSTAEQRAEQRRAAWERAGWVRTDDTDFPENGNNFMANGQRATLPAGWAWSTAPRARIDLPGTWRTCGNVRNWSFSNTAETIDTTRLGDTFRQKVGGLKGITGQAQLMYYRDDDDSDSPLSYLLDLFNQQDSETQPTDVRILFRLRHSSSGTRDYSFPVLLTNWSMNCAVGEVVTVDVSFESTQGPFGSSRGM